MNRLAESTSLYLQQHADNPVEWQPWDDDALAEARDSGRPILLSIGYSACHWCHVMAHESFEDPETARWMNALFVNIKVDREERPDLDRIYQLAHQLMTGRGGGWPLTVFIDPEDLAPFFAGTYFPPEPRHGLPAFRDLLKKVREWYDTHRDEVAEQSQRLTEAIAGLQAGSGADEPPGDDLFEEVREKLRAHYDARHGGFGGAPKFPQAPLLGLVQRLALDEAPVDPAGAGRMLRDSLTRMAMSGLRDHLDGGFFRYTVDGTWTIPHFEKMLYDNAMLLPLYAEAAQHWEDDFLKTVAAGVVEWLGANMRDDNGGYYASIDADAGGHEGGFHVWRREEVESVLDEAEFREVARLFGLDQPPNFEGRAWHLLRADGDPENPVPEAALSKLARARAERVAPATDRKQITSWNALCIEGLARAGVALDRSDWLDLSEQALGFVRRNLWSDGELFAVYAGGRAQFPAYLDDHAGLLHATLVLLQARFRGEYLEFARALAAQLLDRFADDTHGGFCFSSSDAEVPLLRLRPLQDDALPGGNGVAARALLKLGHLTGEGRYLDAARSTLASADREMGRYPLAHASLLSALAEFRNPAPQLVITGRDAEKIAALATAARATAGGMHALHCYAVEPGDGPLPGILGEPKHDQDVTAHLCRGLRCLPPVHGIDELTELLKEEAD